MIWFIQDGNGKIDYEEFIRMLKQYDQDKLYNELSDDVQKEEYIKKI